MRFQSYFNTAVLIITAYDGSLPLAAYLKQHFAQHKKHGSKDRKYISHLCYSYYRLGHALKSLPVEERLKIALFVCTDEIAEWNILFEETWMRNHTSLLRKRLAFIQTLYPFNVTDIFPWHGELSEGIDIDAFALSHLVQPNLFLRVRPGRKEAVLQKLRAQNITFDMYGESTIALPNSTKVDSIIELNKEAVVQDYSSQQIQQLFPLVQTTKQGPIAVWDCCAASGGKAILAHDYFKNIALSVSDIRSSIIHNLQQRFAEAGIKNYHSFVADLANPQPSALHPTAFDLVICDAPCSGSGTWGRTPEQLYFFTEDKLAHYTSLQQKITGTVIPRLQKHGYLLYITCSVFKQENEAIVGLIEQQGLTLVEKKIFTGYDKKADTMFAVLFKQEG